jgi:hypothetical protein
MGVESKIKKMAKDIDAFVLEALKEVLNEEVENIKYLIMDGFNLLSAMVTNPDSKTDPILYSRKFEDRIENFNYIEVGENSVKIHTPDMENFDFSELEIVEQILEGTVGVFVEISQENMEKITGKTVVNNKPVDPSVPKKDRIYLERYTPKVRQKEKEVLEKKLVRFPFSNTPPLYGRVFGPAEEYVSDNIEFWSDEALRKGRSKMLDYYKGVR